MAASKTRTIKALGLCSGGLDSILSALLLISQGINVHWISFETPFFSSDKARYAANKNNISLNVENITEAFILMMKNPKCKFGKNMNPCMDCHSLMFKYAGELMDRNKFDFMFSGEVLGQRPMSQNKNSLRYVEKNSGYSGYVLRPLSAKMLPETIPERKRIVNRELLLGITGRSRKVQFELARKFGIEDYPHPGGGCLLTDKAYSSRLRDLFKYQLIYPENHLHLLRFGRHFRLDDQTKIIVGRNHVENKSILRYVDAECDTILKTCDVPGPVVIIPDGGTAFGRARAASMCVSYSKVGHNSRSIVSVNFGEIEKKIEASALSFSESKQFMIL